MRALFSRCSVPVSGAAQVARGSPPQDSSDASLGDMQTDSLLLPTAGSLRVHTLSPLQLADKLRLQRQLWQSADHNPAPGAAQAWRSHAPKPAAAPATHAVDFESLEQLHARMQTALPLEPQACTRAFESVIQSLPILAAASQVSNAAAARYAVYAARCNDVRRRLRGLPAHGAKEPAAQMQRAQRAVSQLGLALAPLRAEAERVQKKAARSNWTGPHANALALQPRGQSVCSPFAAWALQTRAMADVRDQPHGALQQLFQLAHEEDARSLIARHMDADRSAHSAAHTLRYLLPAVTRDAMAARTDKGLLQWAAEALCKGRYGAGRAAPSGPQ